MTKVASKQTVYVDADDDITALIEVIKNSKANLVALVLPKRADVLKSVVNARLLSRAARASSKQLVLVTADSTIRGISGVVGIYVASNIKSKPAIPDKPEYATAQALAQPQVSKSIEDPLEEVLNAEISDSSKPKLTSTGTASRFKKSDKIKVPSFDAFKKRAAIGLLALIILPGLWFVAYKVLPTATVSLETNASSLNSEVVFNISEQATAVDVDNKLIPSVLESASKQLSQKVTATGQKDVGEKASGLMTISNCTDTEAVVPAGSKFRSGNFVFINSVAVNLDSGNFTASGACKSSGGHVKSITVIAEQSGSQYNLSSRTYTIDTLNAKIQAEGASMSGGTTKVATIVSQQDLDKSQQAFTASRDDETAKAELKAALEGAGYIPLENSFKVEEGAVEATVLLDQEIAEGDINQNINYTMRGLKESDAVQIVLPVLQEAAGNLGVIDSGLDTAKYSITGDQVTVSTSGTAGLIMTVDQVFEMVAGKSTKDAAAELRKLEGVTTAEVKGSPFWVNKVPDKKSKVSISINGLE